MFLGVPLLTDSFFIHFNLFGQWNIRKYCTVNSLISTWYWVLYFGSLSLFREEFRWTGYAEINLSCSSHIPCECQHISVRLHQCTHVIWQTVWSSQYTMTMTRSKCSQIVNYPASQEDREELQLIYSLCVHAHMHVFMCLRACVRIRGQLAGVSSLHNVGFGDQIQVIRLGSRCFYCLINK